MYRLLALFALTVASFREAPAPAPQKPPAELRVSVGDRNYDVVPGDPFTIVTPKGERVELVVRWNEILRYEGHGVSFTYHRTMKVSSEASPGFATITAETTRSPLALIQVYSASVSPGELQKSLVSGYLEEFRTRNGVLSSGPRPVRRRIAGAEREGQTLEILFGGQKMRVEVFTFQNSGTPIAVMLQHDLEEADLARKLFTVIVDSLE